MARDGGEHLREPHHRRARIDAGTDLLNLVHTPDEPADVFRELGVLLSPDQRMEAFARMDAAERWEPDQLVAALYEEAPSHDLDLSGCIQRIERACARVPESATVRAVREGCRQARELGRCDWHAVLAAADAAGIVLTKWDRIVFAAACTETSISGVRPLLSA